ncbi:MAG TPA: hypothetical protein VFI27_17850 [candidate division Zixibacteria bacterium]|nr:hypothetical protein [candidate division Zixibacteria bacterium]
MSQKNDAGLSQTDELICPPMTLAQQVKGTIYLIRLTIEVTRVVLAIIKLIRPYLSMSSRPLPDGPIPPADSVGDEIPTPANPPVELMN